MARRRRKRSGLGYIGLQRFAVDGCQRKKIYTNVVDALLAAKHVSKRSNKTCRVLHGMPGAESRIASCAANRCKTPGGNAISMRKLYEAEQGVKPEANSSHGNRGRSVRNVRARGARKTKGKRVF